jgi:protein-L-isoaspartate(D-aspartate) O-methyltransferase
LDFEAAREAMVADQIVRRGIRDERVLAALRQVPRHRFLPEEAWELAYLDSPLKIGQGQTISQPYIVALMTALLQVGPGDKVLEVGTGSGYQAAVLGSLAKEVHSIERIPVLATQAGANLSALGMAHVQVHVGDGSQGYPPAAPYDRILVAAAAPEAPPALLAQLAEGGRLVIPVGSRAAQTLEIWDRKRGKFRQTNSIPVVFVPLIGAEGWRDSTTQPGVNASK